MSTQAYPDPFGIALPAEAPNTDQCHDLFSARTDTYAKAIVALKREAEFYGRICISPFTWPIEAISEFIPQAAQDTSGGRGKQRGLTTPPVEPGFVSIATLAASVDDAAVIELANGVP